MKIVIFSPFPEVTLVLTFCVKNSLEIAPSLTVAKIFSMFYFTLKSKMAARCRKLIFFHFAQDTLVLPCGSKIHLKSLSFMVFEIFTIFCFLLKSKMATISGENLNFSAKIQDGRLKWQKLKFLPFE